MTSRVSDLGRAFLQTLDPVTELSRPLVSFIADGMIKIRHQLLQFFLKSDLPTCTIGHLAFVLGATVNFLEQITQLGPKCCIAMRTAEFS